MTTEIPYIEQCRLLAKRIKESRADALAGIAGRVVANRDKTNITVPVPNVEVVVPETKIQAAEVTLPPMTVNVPAPEVRVENIVEQRPPDIKVNVPKLAPPNVNVQVPESAPNVNVTLVVPPEAIKILVSLPMPKSVKQVQPPTMAVIEHPDGTVSTIELR